MGYQNQPCLSKLAQDSLCPHNLSNIPTPISMLLSHDRTMSDNEHSISTGSTSGDHCMDYSVVTNRPIFGGGSELRHHE